MISWGNMQTKICGMGMYFSRVSTFHWDLTAAKYTFIVQVSEINTNSFYYCVVPFELSDPLHIRQSN